MALFCEKCDVAEPPTRIQNAVSYFWTSYTGGKPIESIWQIWYRKRNLVQKTACSDFGHGM